MQHLLVFLLIFGQLNLHAAGDSIDPYARMDCTRAFDHSSIDRKYSALMESLGCAANVFEERQLPSSTHNSISGSADVYINLPDPPESTPAWEVVKSPLMQSYYDACIKKLNSAKRSAVYEPAKGGILTIFVLLSVFFTIELILGWGSNYGNLAVYGSLLALVPPVSTVAQSTLTHFYPQKQLISELEIEFAKKQCFIPRALWPIIEAKFAKLRQVPSEWNNAYNFIQFALKFVVYYPLPPVAIANTEFIDAASKRMLKQTLNQEIDRYFADYQEIDPKQLRSIKHTITAFAMQLLGDKQRPNYLYISGPPGIGKSHFVNTVNRWFAKLLPKAVSADRLVVESPEDLIGTSNSQGVFLRALSKMYRRQRHGIIAEAKANWINKREYGRAIDSVFAERLEYINTTYFGEGDDGRGVKLTAPPMLVMLTNTEKIEPAEIENLFTNINFPLPKPEALLKHAIRVFLENDSILTELRVEPPSAEGESPTLPERLEQRIGEHIKSCTNFRQVAHEMAAFTEEFLEH